MQSVFLVNGVEEYDGTQNFLGVYSTFGLAYKKVVEILETDPQELGYDALLLEEWQLDWERVNVHRYDVPK